MRSERAVLEVLFPAVRASLLRLLFDDPREAHYVLELRSKSKLSLHTVQDELRKLSAIGLVTSWSNGYHRFYRADDEHPLFPHVLAIVHISEYLSSVSRSILARPRARVRGTRRVRPRRISVLPDRAVNWHLFSSLYR